MAPTNGNGASNKMTADWNSNPRWAGVTRGYTHAAVLRLRGSVQIEYTLARLGAERLWKLMHKNAFVPALGAIAGNQATEMVQAGLLAIYGSGWQVAADGNSAGGGFSKQNLYPCGHGPKLGKRLK